LTYIIRDDVLFVYVLFLGFIGKYINLSCDLVGILRATVPGDMSRLSAVVTGAVSSRTFVVSLTVVSLVAASSTLCTLVRVTLVDVVQYYRFDAVGVTRKVCDLRGRTIGVIVGAVLTLVVVVLGLSFLLLLLALTVRSELQ
jgi:hypothetical protein